MTTDPEPSDYTFGRPPADPPSGNPPLLITPEMLVAATPAAGPDPRLDFEKDMSRRPVVVLALIVANVGVFVWELASGALESKETIAAAGALVRADVLQGQWWRLVSAMFLHGSVDHLVGNCIALYVVGMACEHAYRRRRTALIYFCSGLCGGLLSTACSPGPSVGASGAIFGVIAACIVFFHKHERAILIRDKRIGFVLAAWAVYQIGCGFLAPMVDNFAHIGGLIGGVALGLSLRPILVLPVPDPIAAWRRRP